MCGIVGVVARSPVNQLLYDGMTVLQESGGKRSGDLSRSDDPNVHDCTSRFVTRKGVEDFASRPLRC